MEGDHGFHIEITDTGHEDVDIGTQSITTVTIIDNDGGFYRETVVVYVSCIYFICCSAQTGQHEPCKGCSVWVLQQICWISLGK